MARIIYAAQALADLDRVTRFLVQNDPAAALATVDLITEAVQVLANHPLIGRPTEQDLRELVISRGASGYLALYSYEAEHDIVFVLAVRHQREAGYTPE
ncbi:type II toxin-antitoxin system RelE/ParE family toxin [Solimonas aquatica]|uniref:type II toxin-antitoxin system RelE/ParE family toxin n=1 Tax=Solimonas aquatica TaxID=489703 RepID=UPI000B85A3EA|nr:type II toxin-antitoxin system RelE/ParE family toxin [Solimonas aquatica]